MILERMLAQCNERSSVGSLQMESHFQKAALTIICKHGGTRHLTSGTNRFVIILISSTSVLALV